MNDKRRFCLTYVGIRFRTVKLFSNGKLAFEDDGDGNIYPTGIERMQGPCGSVNYLTGAVELPATVTGQLEAEYLVGVPGELCAESIGEEDGFMSPLRAKEKPVYGVPLKSSSPVRPRFPRGHLEDQHGRQYCPNCGGKLFGDGFRDVVHCEFAETYGIEPDASPVYCKPEDLDEDDVRPATKEVLKERYQKMRAQADKDLADLSAGMEWRDVAGKWFLWKLAAVIVVAIVAVWLFCRSQQ